MSLGWLALSVVVCAFLLTGLMRRYALARHLLDIPNARSSHTLPTPRGGGVAIVLCVLGGLPVLAEQAWINWPLCWALLGAGAGIALLGFLDDHGHIAARWRLLGHFLAAGWVLFCLQGLPPLVILGTPWALGWLGHVLAAFYLVWLLNLYNFMDGIDGIASVEALCVCAGGALLVVMQGTGSWAVELLLGAAVLGFLFWNFPPAKIFMGDAGSGFLGITLGTLSLQAAWQIPAWLWSWLILLGVFVVDASITLLRRLSRGEKVYLAHRSHAYQYGRHLPVTLGVVAINIGWLLPIALWVGSGQVDGVWGLLLAYTPLIYLAISLRAGLPEAPPNG